MTEDTHKKLMEDPRFAVAMHEHQINKITEYLEEIVERLVNLEKKVLDHETQFNHVPIGPDENDPLKDFPEVSRLGWCLCVRRSWAAPNLIFFNCHRYS